MWLFLKGLSAAMLCFIGPILWAFDFNEEIISVRSAGMGGAILPVVTKTEALFLNPAGLALKTKFIKLKNKNTELTPQREALSSMIWDVIDVKGGANAMDIYDILIDSYERFENEKFYDTLRPFFGKKIWVDGRAQSVITGFGMGAGFAQILEELYAWAVVFFLKCISTMP